MMDSHGVREIRTAAILYPVNHIVVGVAACTHTHLYSGSKWIIRWINQKWKSCQ